MASIVRAPLENGAGDLWPGLTAKSLAWAREHGVALRDAIVLLPFAQLLPLARREWAKSAGWMPRIETTQTLARSLGPASPADESQISFDAAVDRLRAQRLLPSQPWAGAWRRRDPRGFERAVAALVQTAHAVAASAATVAPAERELYWRRGRELLGAPSGPGATERLLARVAFEWAATSAPPATDGLFALRPSAWIVVQAGGSDALADQLLARADGPCLRLDTDAPLEAPFADVAGTADVCLALCADFEAEAQHSAAQVLTHLAAGTKPVALIAQDRLLVRRVRALLARQHVPIVDETGWKLSTTRAGAAIASLLRAAQPRATTDEWLDWLKSCAYAWPGIANASTALQALETELRRRAWTAAPAVNAAQFADAAAALWRAAVALIDALQGPRARSLAGWLDGLRQALQNCGAWTLLGDDDAGRQAVAALHLSGAAGDLLGGEHPMSFDEFTRWVDDALEEVSFLPEASATTAGDVAVVITPLARAMLRPFAAVVFAGVDERRLGTTAPPHPLLGDALLAALGLPDSTQRRNAETLAFAQLLHAPRVTLLRRLDDGGEPLAASPLIERLGLALAQAGRGHIAAATDVRGLVTLPCHGVPHPQPVAPSLLPARLSASACEALRACPYRFFALRLLALRAAEELDDEVEKRDYGTWLHAVLQRFHATRSEPASPAIEEARLHEIALQQRQQMALDPAAFLPYAATFARFAPRYIEWLHERDREGAQWLDVEVELKALPPAWAGVEMHGVIDRVDSVHGAGGPVTQLIDYKTGSAQALRAMLKRPQEDTQLAFYAALMAQQSHAAGDIGALYLPLDDADAIKPIEHKNVEATARQLVEGIGRDLAQLRAGAPMPALGEGRTCEFCEVRGLCRRDHWAPDGEGEP